MMGFFLSTKVDEFFNASNFEHQIKKNIYNLYSIFNNFNSILVKGNPLTFSRSIKKIFDAFFCVNHLKQRQTIILKSCASVGWIELSNQTRNKVPLIIYI